MSRSDESNAGVLLAEKLWSLAPIDAAGAARQKTLLEFVSMLVPQLERIAAALGNAQAPRLVKECAELSAYGTMTGFVFKNTLSPAEIAGLSGAVAGLADQVTAASESPGGDREPVVRDLERTLGRLAALGVLLRKPASGGDQNAELLQETWTLAGKYGRWLGAAAFAVSGTLLAAVASEAAMAILAGFFGLSVASGSGVMGRIVNAVLRRRSGDVAGTPDS